MLIDVSYFTAGSRHILNATLGDESTEANDAIEAYIIEHQEEYLCKMLGRDLGEEFHAYLVSQEDDEVEVDIELEEIRKRLAQSFADYVFFQIIRDSNEQATITGLVRLKGDNSYTSPLQRGVTTWNMMVKRHKAFLAWAESASCPFKGIAVDSEMLTPINQFNL